MMHRFQPPMSSKRLSCKSWGLHMAAMLLLLGGSACSSDPTKTDGGPCLVDLSTSAPPDQATSPPTDMAGDCWELRSAGKDVLACFDFRRPQAEIDTKVTASNWTFTPGKFATCTGTSMTDVTCSLTPLAAVPLNGATTATIVLSHRLTIRRTSPISTSAAFLAVDGDRVLQWKNGGPYVDSASFVQDRVRQTELPVTSISLSLQMNPVSSLRGQLWDVEYLAVIK